MNDHSRRDRQPFRVRQVDRIVSNVGVQVLLAAAKPSGSLAVSALSALDVTPRPLGGTYYLDVDDPGGAEPAVG